TPAGFVVIDVNGTVGPESTGMLHFRVEDSGVGIRPEQVEHLFGRFTQADASTTRRFGGTGLGLAITKQLVELMGGSIGAAPRPEGGSVFFFTLALPLQTTVPAPRTLPDELRDARALVVDDHEVNRQVVTEQLASWQIRSAAATSGPEALAMLKEAQRAGQPFDVVLLDFLMPDMDGVEVSRLARAEPALGGAIIIILSSVERRVAAGPAESTALFDAWLVKPVRQSRLMDAMIAAWVARHGGASAALAAGGAPDAPAPRRVPLSARVLVVDDSAVNQRVAALPLEKLGCRVDVAGNGLEAIDMVARFPYDVVLMDCQMPEMDGYQATTEIRAREKPGEHLPIVAMTAHALAGERDRCLAAGMDDYLTKPLRTRDLEAAVRTWAAKGTAAPVAPPAETSVPADAEGGPPDAEAQRIVTRVREMADDEETTREVLGLFLAGADEGLQDLRRGAQTGDAKLALRAAHKLKGSARNVGAEALAGFAERVEELAQGDSVAGLAALVEEVALHVAGLEAALVAPVGTRGAGPAE
ncbi:MAG TPA: response regulator, partial [Vicinamibacteria bacterium]|nr:response regulator [Vicinamibacteria bacterium]